MNLQIRALLFGILAVFCCQIVFAQKASLNLTCFPSISVADGHSTVTITAEVRDLDGTFVRNGTSIVFETDRGQFKGNNVVQTQNGFARVILVAPGIPGTAKIRASVFSLNASSFLEIDFVNDRSVLDSAKEFVEISSSGQIDYATQDKVIEATAENRGVVLRYRDFVIKADHLQYRPASYEVRARGASYTFGKTTIPFRELYFRLNQRKGVGLISELRTLPQFHSVGFGATMKMTEESTLKFVEFNSQGITGEAKDSNMNSLTFGDLSAAASVVQSKKAVIQPGRSIQFQKAIVKLGGQTVMTMPLFQIDLNTSNPIVTQQFLDVSNSSVAVNYPYYLSLKPGETSALRFRYGNRYSSGLGATSGTYLDYEYNWNRGANMEGGLAVTGLARNDWGVNMRQYWQPNSSSSLSAQIDLPSHKSLFSNLSYNRQFTGFQTSFTAQHGRNLAGDRFQSDQVGLSLDSDPISIGHSPFNMRYGLSANSRQIRGLTNESQTAFGVQARMDSQPIILDPKDTLTISYMASQLHGSNVASPFVHGGSLSLSSSWLPGLFLQTTYEYGQDGFSEDILGRHRLSIDGLYNVGKFNVRSYLSKSLDLDRLTANLNLDYKLGSLWRVSTGYLLDRYAGDTFLEQTFVLGYRLGFREIGLSISTRTKRLGLELLGTRFN